MNRILLLALALGCGKARSVENTLPIACVPSALTAEEHRRSAQLRTELAGLTAKTDETERGYAYRFTDDAQAQQRLHEWIPLERRCCPFLEFDVAWPAGGAPISLRLSGPDGTKAFLKAELPELPLR